MQNKEVNILIAEPSELIKEGFSKIAGSEQITPNIKYVNNFDELKYYLSDFKFDIVIINPSLIQSVKRTLKNFKKKYREIKWIGLVYAFFDEKILSGFDDIITISDSKTKIQEIIRNKKNADSENNNNEEREDLSDREIDVLKLLTEGNSNKQIANKLKISAHTVISHRKNIVQKTGIKSVSGLTIYAVINKIIEI
jgi:DNA-binding NarL/FixJ family response regulator